jgi:hypothetical protein
MCSPEDDDQWIERAERCLAEMPADARASIINRSPCGVWPEGGQFAIYGEGGKVGVFDTRREAEDSIILDTGIFDDA